MIGKISMGAGAAGAINYCYYDKNNIGNDGEKIIRGEILYSNELWKAKLPNGHLHVQSLGEQFHQVAALNKSTTKFIWHQTFNFPPGEKVSSEVMVKIARDFARDFGFENNQYMVFRHRDKPHEHFHIIANRINLNGENTATDKHNYERIQQFCRLMEKKYGLYVTENHRQKLDARHNRKNGQMERLKKIIDAHIPYSQTLSELSIALKKKGIIVYLGRGVSFTDQKYGLNFKGSDLGYHYSRQSIEKRLGKVAVGLLPPEKHKFDGNMRQNLREIIDRVCQQTKPCNLRHSNKGFVTLEVSWKDFENRLRTEGITLRIIRKEITERIIGAAFGMGGRRFVNSHELGKDFTVHALSLRFGSSKQEFEKPHDQYQYSQSKKENLLDQKYFAITEMDQPFSTRLIVGANNANETNKDLTKIAQSLRGVNPKKYKRRIR